MKRVLLMLFVAGCTQAEPQFAPKNYEGVAGYETIPLGEFNNLRQRLRSGFTIEEYAEERLATDKSECRKESTFSSIIGPTLDNEMYRACMEARGYK